MNLTIYHLKTCDSCRKIIKEIKGKGLDYTAIDVRKTPLNASTISELLEAFGPDKLLNKRSTTWRGLSDSEKNSANDNAIKLLQTYPTLMKRPVIKSDKALTLGVKDAAQHF